MCGSLVETKGNFLGDNIGTKNEEKLPKQTSQMKVKCLKENVVVPQHSMQGYAGCDISATCSYVILAQGKGVVQTGLVVLLPLGVYARIAPCSRLAIKNFIDMDARVVNRDYKGEIGIVLFNHSTKVFHVQMGSRIPQLILKEIKTPTIQ